MTKKFWITSGVIAGALLVGFVVIAVVLTSTGLVALPVDSAIANWAYSVRGDMGGACYWFFRIITEFGYVYFVIPFIVLMAIIWKFKGKAWFLAGTVLISWLMHKLIKLIIMRPRPDEAMWWMTESSSSFPSGHSSTVTCLFILLAYFIITSPAVKLWVKNLVTALSTTAIVLVPFSRIILGMHYFTDVLGGMMFGALFAVLGIIAYNVYLMIMQKKSTNNRKNSNPPLQEGKMCWWRKIEK